MTVLSRLLLACIKYFMLYDGLIVTSIKLKLIHDLTNVHKIPAVSSQSQSVSRNTTLRLLATE